MPKQKTEQQPGPGAGDPEPVVVPVVPIQRPSPPTQKAEQGSVIVAKLLAGNLGTAPEISQEMRIDERKMAVLNDYTLTSYNYLSYRGEVDKIRFWKHFVDYELVGSQAIGGLARRQILTAIANSSGAQTLEKAQKPNVIARNFWNRGWKEKASSEGKVVEEY